MTFDEALHQLGVRDDTLTSAEKQRLDRDGFLPLERIITREHAARMHDAMEAIFEAERIGEPGAAEAAAAMHNKSDAFLVCVTHPRVLAAIAHVLKVEFKSLGVHSRRNPPGKGHQALHVDWTGPAARDGEYYYCNSMWPLTDFTEENGATRVVPGSHRFGKNPGEVMADPHAPHPDEVRLVAPVGTVVVFNAHLWHGACQNRNDRSRPNVTSFWCRRTNPYAETPRSTLDPATQRRAGEAVRRLFDPA